MTRNDGSGAVMRQAMAEFEELSGNRPESVSAMRRSEDGVWTFSVEIVEVRRVPDTVSLMATYELHVDRQGSLIGWDRVRRYERGRADSNR